MRANEFITEAATILNVVAHDPRAVALFKRLLTIRGYNHYMRLVRKSSIDDSDVWQGENGWAHVSIMGVTARLTISTDHVEVQVVRLSEVFPTVTQAIGQPTHFYKLITSPLSAADDRHSRDKTLKTNINNAARDEYRWFNDPIFRRYVTDTMNKIIDYFDITDQDTNRSEAEYDLEMLQNAESNEYNYRDAILDMVETSIVDNVLYTMCEEYGWDYDDIQDNYQLNEYLYRAREKDKNKYYKNVKKEVFNMLKDCYSI